MHAEAVPTGTVQRDTKIASVTDFNSETTLSNMPR